MVTFTLWRNDEQGRSSDFDCVTCRQKGWNKRRVCFLKKKRQLLRFPIIKKTEGRTEIDKWEKREAMKDDVIRHLIEVHKLFPNKLLTSVMESPFMELGLKKEVVCPIGLFNYEAEFYTSLESAASEYHCLPYGDAEGSGYLDQPLYIIEAFDTIRAAKAKYNNERMRKLEKTQKKAHK